MALIDLTSINSDGTMSPSCVPLMSFRGFEQLYNSAGASFDRKTGLWLCGSDDGIILTAQYKSLEPHIPDVISDSYYIATSSQTCWKCHKTTEVVAIVLKYCIKTYVYRDEGSLDVEYAFSPEWVKLSDCLGFDPRTSSFIEKLKPSYRADYSKTKKEHCYMNHCQWCGVKLGDFFMHGEPGGAFFPVSVDQSRKISLTHILRPLLGRASVSMSTDRYYDEVEVKEFDDQKIISPDQEMPPRTTDPRKLIEILGERPVKIAHGFCAMCDTSFSNEWCISKHRPYVELRHMDELSRCVLRPSEMKILLNALELNLV